MQKGFTLIELLIVIAIVVILMTATLVALNPFRQIAQANNANRMAGINAILNAVSQRIAENRGKFPPVGNETATDCPTAGDVLPTTETIIGSKTGQFNLAQYVVPDYIAQIPVDPQYGYYRSATDYDTGGTNKGYSIKCEDGRVTICAKGTQLIPGIVDQAFCVSR
jgi:prepilin-type N-terminal cleavage/methylation domain-containing protein